MTKSTNVFNAMFKDRDKWKDISDQDKEDYAFLFNRLFSKEYPYISVLLNNKDMDKCVLMDLWYSFSEKMKYPKWFWSKGKKQDMYESDIKSIMIKFDLNKRDDVFYLLEKYPELIRK